MVYSGVIHLGDCLVEEELHGGTYSLEPSKILGRLPTALLDVNIPIVILIKDNSSEIEMNLQAFLARSYKVRNGKMRIGVMRFEVKELMIMCGFKFLIEDLTELTEQVVD